MTQPAPIEFWLGDKSGGEIWIVDDRARGKRELRNTLGNVLCALPGTGDAVQEAMFAQFGQCASVGVGSVDRDAFQIVQSPAWPLEERYLPPAVMAGRGKGAWTDVDLPL